MQMDEAKRAQDQDRTLADLYRGAINPDGTVNRGVLLQGAAEKGLGGRIPGLQKQFAEADEATAKVAGANANTDATKFKVLKDRLETAGGAINSLLANPNVTHNDVVSTVSGLVQQGVIDAQQGATMVRQLPGNPGMLRQFLMQKGLETMDAAKRMDLLTPKTDIKDTGGAQQVLSTNQLTGEVTPGASFKKTVSPDAQLSAETTRRGQNMVDARARSQQEDGKWQYDSSRGGLVNMKTGEFKQAMQDGKPVGEKGAASDAQRSKDANDAISLIDEADKLLNKATGSYVGKGIDVVAGAFGGSTPGAKNAARLKALEGMLVSKMPKMSGPQSDKDVMLYRQMAALIGDDTVPTATRREALDTVRSIQERYAGMPARSGGKANDWQGSVGASSGAKPASGSTVTVDY